MNGKTDTCNICSASNFQARAVASRASDPVYPGFGGYRHEVYVALSEECVTDSRQILDFWICTAIPRYDLFTEFFDIRHPFSAFIRQFGKAEFQFAGISSIAMILQRETNSTTKPSTAILAHRATAIKRVREQLNAAIWKDGTPLAIAHLAILASIMGERKEVGQHLQAIKNLVGFREDSTALSSHEKDDVLFIESGFCLPTGTSIFARPPWNPIYPECPMDYSSEVIPRGFVNVIRQGYITWDAIVVLERAAKVTCRSNFPTRSPPTRENIMRPRTFGDCIEACPIFLAPDTSTTILEKMILYSLILYATIGTESRARSGWWRASKEYLCRHLPHYRPRTNAERMCLAWLHILTADTYRRGYNYRTISKEGTDILILFLKKNKDFLQGGLPYVEEVMSQFFWPPNMSRYWSTSWDTLIQDMEGVDLTTLQASACPN